MWQLCKLPGILSKQSWPAYDESKTIDNEVEIVVQINGKVRLKLTVPADLDKDALQQTVMENEGVKELIAGKNAVKVISVPGKLVNIVVKG